MKKLEDIPKKEVFKVPDGYFEKLPAIIQSRVTEHRAEKSWWLTHRFSLRLAMPILIVLAGVIFWLNRAQTELNAENILASVQTEDLIAYLSEADLTTEELIENIELNAEEVSNIEESVYEFQLNDTEIENILNEIEP
jgi:hypothetical protein